MSKTLAGKRAFEAMGRSAKSRGMPISYQRQMRLSWPSWARQAWAAGWIMQKNTDCRTCDGHGEVSIPGSYYDFEPPTKRCGDCHGTGKSA